MSSGVYPLREDDAQKLRKERTTRILIWWLSVTHTALHRRCSIRYKCLILFLILSISVSYAVDMVADERMRCFILLFARAQSMVNHLLLALGVRRTCGAANEHCYGPTTAGTHITHTPLSLNEKQNQYSFIFYFFIICALRPQTQNSSKSLLLLATAEQLTGFIYIFDCPHARAEGDANEFFFF